MHFQIILAVALLLLFACHPQPSGQLSHDQVSAQDALNPTGTVNGRRDIRKMTMEQLDMEKSNLEAKLLAGGDSTTLRTLLHPTFTTFNFTDEAYLSGNDYSSNGKLIRHSPKETLRRSLAKTIRESPNFLLFHRHRLVRQQMLLPPYLEIPETQKPSLSTSQDSIRDTLVLDSTKAKDSLVLEPSMGATRQNVETDSLWSGAFRANSDKLSLSPEKFMFEEDCWAWGRKKSAAFRENAYGFTVECSRAGQQKKQKLW